MAHSQMFRPMLVRRVLTLTAAAASVLLSAPPVGAQNTTCRGLAATILGTNGPDVIIGTDGPDVIVSLGGGDTVHGGDGDDVICLGDGQDFARGQRGDDYINGGAGENVIYGNAGSDSIVGGPERDIIWGGVGPDRIIGGPGSDFIRAGHGNDVVEGGNGGDWIEGSLGADLLEGGAGADVLRAGKGFDTLRGGGGEDRLWGGPGDDLVISGPGADRIRAGQGFDRCRIDEFDAWDECEGGSLDGYSGTGAVRVAVSPSDDLQHNAGEPSSFYILRYSIVPEPGATTTDINVSSGQTTLFGWQFTEPSSGFLYIRADSAAETVQIRGATSWSFSFVPPELVRRDVTSHVGRTPTVLALPAHQEGSGRSRLASIVTRNDGQEPASYLLGFVSTEGITTDGYIELAPGDDDFLGVLLPPETTHIVLVTPYLIESTVEIAEVLDEP